MNSALDDAIEAAARQIAQLLQALIEDGGDPDALFALITHAIESAGVEC